MDSIRIKNLKCLKDTGEIEIKAISLLVGANSSGKSTFLRTFPLLKQSTRVGKRGPILWYGEDVDFGSFDIAKRRGEEFLEFSFSLNKTKNIAPLYYTNAHKFSFSVRPSKKGEYVERIKILSIDQDLIELLFNSDHNAIEVNINEVNVLESIPFKVISTDSTGLLPKISVIKKNSRHKDSREIEKYIAQQISSLIHDTLGDQLPEHTYNDYYLIRSLNYHSTDKLKDDISSLVINDKKNKNVDWSAESLTHVRNSLIVANLDSMIDAINYSMYQKLQALSYVKPVRASAERYYRSQNLSVKNLDSDGHNMAMFLNELNKDTKRKAEFQQWTKEYFSFIVETEETAGHISVKIQDSSEETYDNIADMGFGYSQILPIIIMMWSSINSTTHSQFAADRIIAIEQPELHLHPKLQAQFADALVAIVKSTREQKVKVKFIIETHSKVIINKLGINVAKGYVSKNDISLLLFDEKNLSNTTVRYASFTEKGFLNDWPIGFLDA